MLRWAPKLYKIAYKSKTSDPIGTKINRFTETNKQIQTGYQDKKVISEKFLFFWEYLMFLVLPFFK
jgi:hypothetical protein